MAATTAADTRGAGGRRVRKATQATISAGAVYWITRAAATGMRDTAV